MTQFTWKTWISQCVTSLISTTLVIYLFCKHKHIRTLVVTSLILHKIKEVEVNPNSEETTSGFWTLTYVGIILTVLSMVNVIFLHYRKSSLCIGYKFSNAIKVMLFISDIQNYVKQQVVYICLKLKAHWNLRYKIK